jgi:uncharacterized membrane protein YpjA
VPWVQFIALAHRFKVDVRLLVLVALADLAGIIGGWYYYAEVGQFDGAHLLCGPGSGPYCTPIWAWPLVADSPNAVLLALAAIFLYRAFGWRNKWLDAFAFTLNIYVGLWTTALFISYANTMDTFGGSVNTLLFVTHMGMPLQSLILLQDMRRDAWKAWQIGLVFACLATFVAVDYWGPHWHPAPQVDAHTDDLLGWAGDAILKLESVFLMAATALAWLWLARPFKANGRQETA